MSTHPIIFSENETLFRQALERAELFRIDPQKIYPWWLRPCRVNVLLLADGALDFGPGDFGLSTFVHILSNDGRSYVRFNITIAHRSGFVGDPGISVTNQIANFRFTNNAHFTETMYDQVWLFGIVATEGGLSNEELIRLSKFMNEGGGVFATGDHGELGRSLCGSVTRVRSMRRWNNNSGEVGMSDARRNDTNRVGHDAGTQFNDQSDDVPQTIQPKLYSSILNGFWRETYPHPLLCSPLGRITVMPDHPHEGECVEPTDLSQTYLDGSPEFPLGIAPELIAFSSVPAGNTAGTKQATQAHSFGSICAYDGHRAKVGRVVTDATWHHFININLVGELGTPDTETKGLGFLASASGQQHFRFIKHYFVNIAVWISRPTQHICFNRRTLWELVFNHRVIEATMDNPTLVFDRISPSLLYAIGTHAIDVVGKSASQCRKLKLMIDLLEVIWPEFALQIDPWNPTQKPDSDPMFPWIDPNPFLALAMGAGLLAIRDEFKIEDLPAGEKIEESILEVFQKGARRGIDMGLQSLNASYKNYVTGPIR